MLRFTLLFAVFFLTSVLQAADSKPNVLVIVGDDMG